MRSIRRLQHLALGLALLLTGGCTHNMVRDVAGGGIVSFGNDYISPWFMASEDTDILCAMGEGMGGMIYPLAPATDAMIPMITLASGGCASERALEEELRYMRAMRRNDVNEAQDARTRQKRWLEVAARRQLAGYQATVRYFGEPGGECPEFEDRNEELSYILGLFGGFQAFQIDLSNGGTAGVPLDIMPKAVKGLKCVNSDEFWGLPNAVDAMVDIMKAKLGGEKEALDAAHARLSAASAVGEAQGVRMVHLLEATLYDMQGDDAALKDTIRRHVSIVEKQPADPAQRLLDRMASRGILQISDKLWTQNTGQRTPYGKFGTFWDDALTRKSTAPDIDDLL